MNESSAHELMELPNKWLLCEWIWIRWTPWRRWWLRYNVILLSKNIKIESNPFFHRICDWFSWESSKKIKNGQSNLFYNHISSNLIFIIHGWHHNVVLKDKQAGSFPASLITSRLAFFDDFFLYPQKILAFIGPWKCLITHFAFY